MANQFLIIIWNSAFMYRSGLWPLLKWKCEYNNSLMGRNNDVKLLYDKRYHKCFYMVIYSNTKMRYF